MLKKSFFRFKNRTPVLDSPPVAPEVVKKTKTPKAEQDKLLKELTKEARKLFDLKEKLKEEVDYAKNLFREDEFSYLIHSWGVDFYDPGKTVDELNHEIAKLKEQTTQLKEERESERAKAIKTLEEKLSKAFEKIENEKKDYHLFDLQRYRKFLTLINSARDTEERLRTGQNVCKQTLSAATNWEELQAEANRLGKNKTVLEEATNKLLEQYLKADSHPLSDLQRELITETLTSPVLVKVEKSRKKTKKDKGLELEILEVEAGSNLYQIPALLLNQAPWSQAQETISVIGLDEEEIQTIITLYTSGSYKSLSEARDAAKAI